MVLKSVNFTHKIKKDLLLYFKMSNFVLYLFHTIIANHYKALHMSPNYFSEQYTECYKMIIDDLHLVDGMELSSDTIRRLANVTEKECYGIWIDVTGTYLPSTHDPEDFIVRCLNDIDYYKLKNEIEKMKSAIHKRDKT